MSNAKKFAEKELNILLNHNTNLEDRPVIEEFIPELLALVDKFGKSGQSGGSAPYVASALSNAVKNLCLQNPISPITGIDEEWNNVTDYGDGESSLFQNNRCSALFKNDEGTYYLDAIVWINEEGDGHTGRVFMLSTREMIRSSQFIKKFPFKPKTFYVDVVSVEVAKDDWIYYIKDEEQLDKVFEYYKSLDFTRKVIIEKQFNNSLL